MSKLVINDLESDETLDALARRSITGGSRHAALVNAPSAAQHRTRPSDTESKLIRGLMRTVDLRGLTR